MIWFCSLCVCCSLVVYLLRWFGLFIWFLFSLGCYRMWGMCCVRWFVYCYVVICLCDWWLVLMVLDCVALFCIFLGFACVLFEWLWCGFDGCVWLGLSLWLLLLVSGCDAVDSVVLEDGLVNGWLIWDLVCFVLYVMCVICVLLRERVIKVGYCYACLFVCYWLLACCYFVVVIYCEVFGCLYSWYLVGLFSLVVVRYVVLLGELFCLFTCLLLIVLWFCCLFDLNTCGVVLGI